MYIYIYFSLKPSSKLDVRRSLYGEEGEYGRPWRMEPLKARLSPVAVKYLIRIRLL